MTLISKFKHRKCKGQIMLPKNLRWKSSQSRTFIVIVLPTNVYRFAFQKTKKIAQLYTILSITRTTHLFNFLGTKMVEFLKMSTAWNHCFFNCNSKNLIIIKTFICLETISLTMSLVIIYFALNFFYQVGKKFPRMIAHSKIINK